jgi:hypothetical protein
MKSSYLIRRDYEITQQIKGEQGGDMRREVVKLFLWNYETTVGICRKMLARFRLSFDTN